MLTQSKPDAVARPIRSLWMHGPMADTLLGWCWLPIAVAVHLLASHITLVQSIVGVIFLISFAHQPLTLALVYGDPVQRAAHRRLYLWAPAIAFVLIVVGINVSLTLVALVAVLWNAEHTLMQRYGVMRIYGRKAGDQHGRLEKPMLIVWLIAGISFIGAFTDLDAMVNGSAWAATTPAVCTCSTHCASRPASCLQRPQWRVWCSRLAGGVPSGRSGRSPAGPSTSMPPARSAWWWP